MINLITTIPASNFKTWELAERVLRRCDGTTDWDEVDREGTNQGKEWLWFIRCHRLPKKPLTDSVCFMIYSGRVRGYFHIVSSGRAQEWVDKGYLLEDKPSGYVVVMANWVAIPESEQTEYSGFQGWRYTEKQP
ncbi:hypothetical protein [Fibrella aestuarina]|nr:hypothetical protein [Fibrella aestuarina]